MPSKKFHVLSQYFCKPCKVYEYCWENKYAQTEKITCPVEHVTTNVYLPWDRIYMPRACGHALMLSPVIYEQWLKLKSELSKEENWSDSLKFELAQIQTRNSISMLY